MKRTGIARRVDADSVVVEFDMGPAFLTSYKTYFESQDR